MFRQNKERILGKNWTESQDLLNDSIFRYYLRKRGELELIMTGNSPNLLKDLTLLIHDAGKQFKQENMNSHAYTNHCQSLESKKYRANLERRRRKIKHSKQGNDDLVTILLPIRIYGGRTGWNNVRKRKKSQ